MADKVKFVFPGLDERRVVTWPCKISVPVHGGNRQDQWVNVRFNVLSEAEVLAAFTSGGNAGLFGAAVHGFDELRDENGYAVADEDAKTLFRKLPYAVNGIIDGFTDMLGRRQPKN